MKTHTELENYPKQCKHGAPEGNQRARKRELDEIAADFPGKPASRRHLANRSFMAHALRTLKQTDIGLFDYYANRRQTLLSFLGRIRTPKNLIRAAEEIRRIEQQRARRLTSEQVRKFVIDVRQKSG